MNHANPPEAFSPGHTPVRTDLTIRAMEIHNIPGLSLDYNDSCDFIP